MNNYQLERIKNEDFESYYKLLEQDFCLAERKTAEGELESFNNPIFNPCFILKGGKQVGYICLWSFEDSVFIEHFAIFEDIRSHGIGTEFLGELLPTLQKKVVLEAERPTDAISEARIRFYRKIGFTVNSYDYIQPSYHGKDDEVPMYLCSYKGELSQDEYDGFIRDTLTTVYN